MHTSLLDFDRNSSDEDAYRQQHQANSGSSKNAEETKNMSKDLDKLVPIRTVKSAVEVNNVVPQEVNISEDIDRENGAEEKLGSEISSQLAEVTQKQWTNESQKPQMVSKIADGLKISEKFPNNRVSVFN